MDGYLYLSEAPDKLVAMIKFAVDYRGRWRAVESAFDDTIPWLRQNLILKLAGPEGEIFAGKISSCYTVTHMIVLIAAADTLTAYHKHGPAGA